MSIKGAGNTPTTARRLSACLLLAAFGTAGCAELQTPGGMAGAVASEPAALVAQGQPAIEQAQIAYELGDLAEARRLFTAILQREPNNLGAALGLGETLMAAGDTDAAAPHLSRVAEQSLGVRQKARAEAGLGVLHLRKGEIGRARTVLEKSTMADPDAWRGWLALGQVYDRQREFAKARRAYARAESSAPGEAIVLNDLGVSLLAEGKAGEAVAAFERAFALDPNLEVARQNIRLARASQGNYTEAVAGATEQELPAVLNNVGYIAILNGDLATAESLLTRALQLSPYYSATTVANLELLESARGGNAG